jgi:hypothetical protein
MPLDDFRVMGTSWSTGWPTTWTPSSSVQCWRRWRRVTCEPAARAGSRPARVVRRGSGRSRPRHPAGHHALAAPRLVRLLPGQLVAGVDPGRARVGGDWVCRGCSGRPARRPQRWRTWSWTGSSTCSGLPASWRIDAGPGGGVLQMSASDSTHTALVVARERPCEPGRTSADSWSTRRRRPTRRSRRGRGWPGSATSEPSRVDEVHAMDPVALAEAVRRDREDGWCPARW